MDREERGETEISFPTTCCCYFYPFGQGETQSGGLSRGGQQLLRGLGAAPGGSQGASRVGGSSARWPRGHSTERGTAAGPTGPCLWLQASPGAGNGARARGQDGVRGGGTERRGCEGNVVVPCHGTRMPQGSPRTPALDTPAGRDGACQMHQLREQFPWRSGYWVLVLGFVPRTGRGHRLQAGQSAMTGQGRGAGKEQHGPGRLW